MKIGLMSPTSQNNIYTIYFDGQFRNHILSQMVNQSYPIAIGYLNWDQNGNNQCDENEERLMANLIIFTFGITANHQSR